MNEEPAIRAQILLCDAAQVVGDKFYILGGGWSYVWLPTGSQFQVVLAIDLIVPWHLGNRKLNLLIELLTEDSEPVLGEEDNEDSALRAEGTTVAGRGPLAREGTDLHVPLVVPFPPVVLGEGGYRCQLTVDNVPIARAPFQVGLLGSAEPG